MKIRTLWATRTTYSKSGKPATTPVDLKWKSELAEEEKARRKPKSRPRKTR